MNEIKNYDVYNARMSTTLYDKCWWIDKIDDRVNVVVDYGCGDGSLYTMINQICPGRFTYVGIDNDETMLSIARINVPNGRFYRSADELARDFWAPSNLYCDQTVLVMNSVMHEILTYLNDADKDRLFEIINKKMCPKYIAVRDMHAGSTSECPDIEIATLLNKIRTSNFVNVAIDYGSSYSAKHHNKLLNNVDYVTEFFLKYTYVENWERERDEVYLWDWDDFVNDNLAYKYKKMFESNFYIPFIRQRIKKDFDIDWDVNTHRKVLYVCT